METDETDPYPRPGDVIARKFRVERLLGQGATGAVFEGRHLDLDERVAIKLLLPELRTRPDLVERFLREAKAAVKIKSEHVGRVMDVGTLATGVPYMVMEYLEGSDLDARLREHGPLPIPEAIRFLLQACEAIAEAHRLNIVHRDLKPANLFIAKRPGGVETLKILDFGISKAIPQPDDKREKSLTGAKVLIGSPDYMSPEQIIDPRSVDARADIWSLGICGYELITGGHPFDATDVTSLFHAVLEDQPTPLRKHLPDAPEGLELALAKCLEKDPAKRFQDVAELAAALAENAGADDRTSAAKTARVLDKVPTAPSSGEVVAPPPRTTVKTIPPAKMPDEAPIVPAPPAKKPPVVLYALAAVIVVASAVAGFLLFRHH